MFSDHIRIKLETNEWKYPQDGKLTHLKITHWIRKKSKGKYKVFYTKLEWKHTEMWNAAKAELKRAEFRALTAYVRKEDLKSTFSVSTLKKQKKGSK